MPDSRVEIAADVNLIAMLFLRLIKMIIAPLVFATLVGGIAHMGSGSKLGRVFAKTMGWFVSASFVSLLLGLVMVNLLQPGANFPGTLPDKAQSTGLPVSAFSIEKFLTHLIPTSIADAMAQNEILQIVVFAVFFAVALGAMPERAKPIMGLIDDLAHIMLKVTGYVMLFAPIAVWAAIMATVSKNGLGVLWKLIVFMGGFYLSLMILWAILVVVGFIVIGPRYSHLLRLIREPLMIAFSTASSEAAYPKTLEGLNRFGASSRISAFVLPLGYSFNLDGTMMYCTFASIFIAQTYHIEMSLGTQLAMLATLMITSKGVAGVPRASLVVIASTLSQFGIPEAGLLMIMGIDTFLDMGRSATNVIGNSLATAVVAKWEGELKAEHELGPDDVVPADAVPGDPLPAALTGEMHASVPEGRWIRGRRPAAGRLPAGNVGVGPDRRQRRAQPDARQHQADACRAPRLSRELAAVLVPRPLQPADRLQPRTVRGDRRGDRRRGRRRQPQDRIRQGHLGRPHPGGDAEQDRPRMRLDHGQCRARQTGGVLAADVRGRHQADGAEGVDDLGARGSEGQDRGGDQRHHQRAGDARDRQEVFARA